LIICKPQLQTPNSKPTTLRLSTPHEKMKNILDKIKLQLNAKLPFAVYSKPGSNAVTGLFQKDATVHYLNDYSQKGFVFAPFDGDERVFIPANAAEVITAEIDTKNVVLAEPLQPAIDEAAKGNFETLVAKGIVAIQQGRFAKVVLSRNETVALTNDDVAGIYTKLLAAYPAAFRYCFYTPQTGLWMGATPEQLLQADNNGIHTVALAGTQLYKEGQIAVWPAKEQQEQQFVTDFILDELKGYAVNINTSQPYTYRAGNIVHIKTDITAHLNDTQSLQNVINTLHPTPAICGLPKADAKDFILQNEGYNREYYSGFLGELNADFGSGQNNKTDLFVNLRCMKIGQGMAHLYIGCGVTIDSNPEKEFIETVNKSATMRKILK
jgi:isochorismate synthase